MAPLSKRKQAIKEVTKERERQRKIRKMQEERGWESSEEEEDVAVRTIDAYSAGLCYGTEEFKHNVNRSHRQVEDKSKW